MTYRHDGHGDDEGDPDRLAARAALANMAAAGAAARRDDLGARAAQTTRARQATSAAARARFAAACAHGVWWHTPVLLVPVTVCGGAAIWLLVASEGRTVMFVAAAVAVVLGALLPMLIVDLLRRGLIEAELARLDALPFRVDGYQRALSQEPRRGTIRLKLRFVGAQPDGDMMAGLSASLGGTFARHDAEESEITSGLLEVNDGDGADSNGAFYRWLRHATGDVLPALHRAYPLTSVEVER